MESFVTGDSLDKWVKPIEEMFKVNMDAALFANTERYSFVLAVRDSTGSMVEAGIMCKARVTKPEVVEALGVKEALSWIKTRLREK